MDTYPIVITAFVGLVLLISLIFLFLRQRKESNTDTHPKIDNKENGQIILPVPHATSSSSFNIPSVSSAISDYAEHLKYVYETALISDDNKWPPTPSKEFIRLSLSEHCHSSNDRQEISIEKVLDLEDEGPFQIVLVEGAPGMGKSMLCWELCRYWDIFPSLKQYSLVVLLRLRDTEVQSIKDIAGLFDGEQDVAKEIKKVHGKGVLFILDGFDELPVKLQKEGFLIDKIISGKAFPKSTVFVTSRTSATATLLTRCKRFLKRRIEVLGFTPVQVVEYAKSVFEDSKMLREFLTYISAAKNSAAKNSAINSLMNVPLNAAIVVALYQDRSNDSGPMPSTMTELYIELSLTRIKRYLDCPVQAEVIFKDLRSLSEDRYKEFLNLCKIAYEGISDNLNSSLVHFGFLNAVPSNILQLPSPKQSKNSLLPTTSFNFLMKMNKILPYSRKMED